jgi:Nif-specific regulatory protein
MASLVVQTQGRVTSTVPLRPGFRVGRDPRCDLCLADAGVSRNHAEFAVEGDGYAVVDLDSKHGVFVNGDRVERRALCDGDRIGVGSASLRFQAGVPEFETVHRQVTSLEPPRPVGDSPAVRRLRLLYDVSRAVGALAQPEDLLRTMMDATLDLLGCERCVVGLLDETSAPLPGRGRHADGGGSAPRQIVRTRDGTGAESVVVSATLLEAILGRREAVLVRDASDPGSPRTLVREGIRSAMGVPLGTKRRLLGFLYVDDRGAEDRFASEDVDFLFALAGLTAIALQSAEDYRRVADEAAVLRAETDAGELLGESEPMKRLRALLDRYAAAGSNVLIRGESGTGKELAARMLHRHSSRAERAFVAVNCAAIPDTMIESELFGHEKGAFTGATRDRRGKFSLADKGTLFLDEVGDLSLAAQAKLLRVIQDGELQPLGSERGTRVDVRIVAATHKDLAAEIAAGRFREDLYYRLAVVEVAMPPLRERGDDVLLLATLFLQRAGSRMGKRLEGFSPRARSAVSRGTWPGNVRQLANEVERAAILADGSVVDEGSFSARVTGVVEGPKAESGSLPQSSLAERYAELGPAEKTLVEEAMRLAKGNQSEAARLLGITRIVLRRRLERFGIGEA